MAFSIERAFFVGNNMVYWLVYIYIYYMFCTILRCTDCSINSICRSFVTTDHSTGLAYPSRIMNQRGHGLCCMSTGRKKGVSYNLLSMLSMLDLM